MITKIEYAVYVKDADKWEMYSNYTDNDDNKKSYEQAKQYHKHIKIVQKSTTEECEDVIGWRNGHETYNLLN